MAGLFSKSGLFYEAGSNSGGGSDPHNLGWYETPTALSTAHPTAVAGDWAIVGSTDTVWVWDTDTSAWVDSDQKGQVTSVNNQTGAVTLDINDVAPTQTDKSGYVLGTDGFVAGWVKPEIVQRSALPAASEDEVGNIYEYVGTTDANYTNGYFYKCVSDGQQPATYSWTQVNVQPAPVIPDPLPSQTGNAGKFLTTDGTDASWGQLLVDTSSRSVIIGNTTKNNPNQTANVVIGGRPFTSNSAEFNSQCICIGDDSLSKGQYGITIGLSSEISNANAVYGIAIGYNSKVSASNAIQLGYYKTNSDANTFKVGNANGNFEIMSADGTIPTDRFTTTPSADGTYVPTLTISSGTATRTWGAPAGGLPSQTGQSGKFLTTDGTDASWSNGTTESLYFKNSNSNMTGARIYSSGGQVLYVCAVQSDGTDNGYGYSFGVNTFRPEGPNFNLGESVAKWGTTYTTKLNNGGNITVPAVAGSMSVQVSSMPTASSTLEGQIYQFTGTTDSTYTHGYLYECVSDGQTPATYSWTAVQVQAGGGSSLPSQTGNAGKFLTTDGTDASWSDKPLVNTATKTSNLVISSSSAEGLGNNICIGNNTSLNSFGQGQTVIGQGSQSSGSYNTIVGRSCSVLSNGQYNIIVGSASNSTSNNNIIIAPRFCSVSGNHSIQLSTSDNSVSNSDSNTFKVANNNGNFEIMSADGTIPTDRFTTTPVSDGTYVPTLTISSGVATRSWAAPGGGGATSATATLAVADWSSNTQTVNVTGVTASNNVIVAAAPASQSDYASFGVLCTAQGAGTLTFTCTTTPTNAITVNVLII